MIYNVVNWDKLNKKHVFMTWGSNKGQNGLVIENKLDITWPFGTVTVNSCAVPFVGSSLKCTVLGQSGRSFGVKLDGLNYWFTLAQMTVQFDSRLSTFGRTIQFCSFGPSTLDLTPFVVQVSKNKTQVLKLRLTGIEQSQYRRFAWWITDIYPSIF